MSNQSANQDRELTCVDCGAKFDWTTREQEYFREQGFADPPKRCKACQQAKKARHAGRDDHGPKAGYGQIRRDAPQGTYGAAMALLQVGRKAANDEHERRTGGRTV